MKNNQDDEMYVKLLAGRNAREFKEQMEGRWVDSPKWKPVVFIVAREYRHAEFLAHANQIPRKDWRYVSIPADLYGKTGQVVFYGPWYELRDGYQIEDYVKTLKDRFQILELSDKSVSIGMDISATPDIMVISAPCGNCGVYRKIENGVMQKCTNCGDDETDLNEEIQIP